MTTMRTTLRPRTIASVCALLAVAGLGACTQTLTAEPPAGQLRSGVKVLVDDGSCPPGQVKEVTGGNRSRGIARQRVCIDRPA